MYHVRHLIVSWNDVAPFDPGPVFLLPFTRFVDSPFETIVAREIVNDIFRKRERIYQMYRTGFIRPVQRTFTFTDNFLPSFPGNW